MSDFKIGRIEATDVRFGDHNLMVVNNTADALTAAIREHRAELIDPASVEEAAAALRQELAAAAPNRQRVLGFVNAVGNGAGTIPAIAEALGTVRRLVHEAG